MIKFDYEIIATGSSGNAVLITCKPANKAQFKILFDMGISYKRLEKALSEASFVFISHRHGDHINPSAYNKLTIEHPKTTIISNQDVYEFTQEKGLSSPDIILNEGMTGYLGDVKVTAFYNYHGVQCNGWILELEGETLLYSTDLSTTLEYSEYLRENKKQVDYLLLEGNYDVNVYHYYVHLKGSSVEDLFNAGSARHLPIQEWESFKNEFTHSESKIEMLHTSSTYGTPEGLIITVNKERDKYNARNNAKVPHITLEQYYNWLNAKGGK